MGAGDAGRAPGAALSRVPGAFQLCVADRHAAGHHRHPVQPAAGGRRLLPPVPGQPLARGVQAARSRPPDLPAEEPREPARVPGSAAVNVAVDLGARNIGSPLLWAAFLVGVLVVLALDLRISSRDQSSTFKEALWWSIFWIVLSVGFGFFVWFRYGGEQGLEFFAGYLLEKSLSVDNLFVFVLLFRSFAIPAQYQHRVLFWGVLGAILLRGTLILGGVALVQRFHWIIAVFGAILVYTAWKILFHKEEETEPSDNAVVRWVARKFPMTTTIEGSHFFVKHDGRRFGTPLLLALVAAETTDLIFAL